MKRPWLVKEVGEGPINSCPTLEGGRMTLVGKMTSGIICYNALIVYAFNSNKVDYAFPVESKTATTKRKKKDLSFPFITYMIEGDFKYLV